MNKPTPIGFLLKVPKTSIPAAGLRLGAALGISGMEVEPLFDAPATPDELAVFGAVAEEGWRWHLARTQENLTGTNPWDLAHHFNRQALGAAAGAPVFVEPDFLQQWIFESPGARTGLAAGRAVCQFEDQRDNLPGVPRVFAWHLDNKYAQLGPARADALAAGGTIRIAHLDTGYYRDHKVLPEALRRDLQRNFIGGPVEDASDPGAEGFLKNPGHGTGTLSILAGRTFAFNGSNYNSFRDYLGGAPQAEIIPVRVGTSVVQISTGSVAKGISYAVELSQHDATRIHVISMSMGGVASQAWADAVNNAYEAGIVYVAAAGNNYSGLPTRFIVYPARFRRVIAACGVMANGTPYYDLPIGTMQGNWGPQSKMVTAMAAFTPNMPWAKYGCAEIVDMDGQGTSSATPQIAAAAALYQQKHAAKLFDRGRYQEPWMRVEAVRHALFTSARGSDPATMAKLGTGILQAAQALAVAPAAREMLRQTPRDSATFAFLRALTGLGAAPADSRREMLALEATQLAQRWNRADGSNPFELIIRDPDLPAEGITPKEKREYLEAILGRSDASQELREYIAHELGRSSPSAPKAPTGRAADASAEPALPHAPFVPPRPPWRRLRGFGIDPSLSTRLDTQRISQVVLSVPWEELAPGPIGEYLEVIDTDPGSRCFYEPINLNDPALLAQDGLPPSEGTPQFHQQMVYAVVSLTIHNFEHALGRRTLWRPGPSPDPKNPKDDSVFVQRLRVYPHALRERNAYYTPQKIALLFGYFRASMDDPGGHMGGGMVFSCLSHDIIAHETTHALLDGMHRSLLQPSNPDVFAFHEAFADIIALFQHFTFPEILRHQISTTRGEIRSHQNFLGELAGEFGRGMGLRGALRDAIGKIDDDGEWKPHTPDPAEYEKYKEPHERGALLVAAVFDAFLSIYEHRTGDLLRLATGGSGILNDGAIHPDLVNRLANEAAKAANHVLTICIRAVDYCPPTDITFGEYLRALITADFDLVEDDDLQYRVAFVEAFRKRGLYPRGLKSLSVGSLLWRGPENDELRPSLDLQMGLLKLRHYADSNLYSESRAETFHLERNMRMDIHEWLKSHFATNPNGALDAGYLGLDPDPVKHFEVRAARFAYRWRPDGGMIPQLIVVLLQSNQVPVSNDDPRGPQMLVEGGCTVIVDLRQARVRYCIRKSVNSTQRIERQREAAAAARRSTHAVYFGTTAFNCAEPFAALHRGF